MTSITVKIPNEISERCQALQELGIKIAPLVRKSLIDKVNECYASLGSEFLNCLAKVRELKENMEVKNG